MKTLESLIAAARTEQSTGNLTAVPALLDQATILANELGQHALAHDLQNAYVEAKVAAWG